MKKLASTFVLSTMIVASGCKTERLDESGNSQAKMAPGLGIENVVAGEGQGWSPRRDQDTNFTFIYLASNDGPAIEIGNLGTDRTDVASNAFRKPTFRFAGGKLNDLNGDKKIYSQIYFAENGIRSTLANHKDMVFRISYWGLDCGTREACTAKLNNKSNGAIVTSSGSPELVTVHRVGNPKDAEFNDKVYFELVNNVTLKGPNSIATSLEALEDGIHFKIAAPIYVKVLDSKNKPLYESSNPNHTFVPCLN